jgi:hypothetical protein
MRDPCMVSLDRKYYGDFRLASHSFLAIPLVLLGTYSTGVVLAGVALIWVTPSMLHRFLLGLPMPALLPMVFWAIAFPRVLHLLPFHPRSIPRSPRRCREESVEIPGYGFLLPAQLRCLRLLGILPDYNPPI